jgi:hypothetical protein
MKWTSHKLLTGAIIFAITGNPIAALATAVGSTIPDAVEGIPTESNYYRWRARHRQVSHWFVPYLVTFLLFQSYSLLHPVHLSFSQLWAMANGDVMDHLPIFSWLIAMLSLGACFHIAEDALCGKVPGIKRKKRVGVKLFYVGSVKEYAFVLPVSAILFLLRIV